VQFSFLSVDWLLSQFGKQRASAQRKYERFVAEGISQPSPWEQLQRRILLGDQAFVDRMQPGLRDKQHLSEIPRRQRFAARPALGQLFTPSTVGDRRRRDALIRRAHLDHGYSLSEIGRVVRLHYSTVSRIVSAQVNGPLSVPHRVRDDHGLDRFGPGLAIKFRGATLVYFELQGAFLLDSYG
jgi:putative transposase